MNIKTEKIGTSTLGNFYKVFATQGNKKVVCFSSNKQVAFSKAVRALYIKLTEEK